MTTPRRLARLEKQAAGQPEAAGLPGDDWAAYALNRPADEGQELARATAAAYAELVSQYREHWKLSAQQAIARAEETSAAVMDHVLHAPPDQVGWYDLNTIAQHDPAAAQRRWEDIKEAARAEVRTGHRSAEALTWNTGACWVRARFLAVRAELIDSLGPRNAAELLLIDQMATYQTQLWEWQATLTGYAGVAAVGTRDASWRRAEPESPRLTDAEAMDRAAAMVERLQRLFLQTLASFHAQRRQAPVVVRRAGQVNLAHNQQISMTG
jgi:hypothetical protein